MAPTIGNEGGPFHRVRDKRLVRQVLSAQHQPHHWMPMDITATECKLMEVKKFSAEFHEIDVKFRKPNFELICVYAVQREQMKMQQESLQANLRTGLKEKQFFYPTT